MVEQSQVFSAGEGDAWFNRNRHGTATFDLANDPVARCITASGLAPRTILDLGCSAGTRLTALCQHLSATGAGIDPSAAAISEARTRDPSRNWHVGTLDQHPLLQQAYDLVIISFVLHWVDRRLLLRSLAAIDGVVAPGGHVLISDFSTDHPVRREYHHLAGQGVFTYKNDYPAMLLATGLYRPVLRQYLGYPDFTPVRARARDRVQVALLERIEPEQIPLETQS